MSSALSLITGAATGGVTDVLSIGGKLIDDAINKIWPDPQAKASAEALIMKTAADAALAANTQAMSVMLAEAQSGDKWTSRARPSFLYVMYIIILMCIPFAIVWAVAPQTGANMANGMKFWLAAIPDQMWQLFGFCYCGYSAARTIEKFKGVAK